MWEFHLFDRIIGNPPYIRRKNLESEPKEEPAKMCANMLDNEDFESFSLNYIEIEWFERNEFLECSDAYYANLFKATPKSLYINWAAALQIQFFVSSLDQSFGGTRKIWCREYLRNFVESASRRCEKMKRDYITPFLGYL